MKKRPAGLVGLEVSKDHLDLACRSEDTRWRVANDHAGITQCLAQLRQLQLTLIVLAATGGWQGALVAALAVSKRPVTVMNPRQIQDVAKATGRPSKLTKTPKHELAQLIDAGPGQAGFTSACWRSPMIQQVIYARFGVFYNVFYLAQLLKHLGFSYQKAAFVSAHLHEEKRQVWCTTTWPQIVKAAQARAALLLLGDEASCPQWGPLAYTWARRGHQPMVKTSGKRKGDKVFGLIEYFTGRFWYQGQEGRLNSETYIAFLTRVLAQTTQPIMLIQDGARYHTSAAMQRFFGTHIERLTVFQSPSYSPDDNPIEKLWKKVKKEGTPLHYFPTFEALTDTVERALLKFANTPAEILALCSLPTELAPAA